MRTGAPCTTPAPGVSAMDGKGIAMAQKKAGSRPRTINMALAVVLAAGMLAGLAPSAGASDSPCRVKNRTTKVVYTGSGENLQAAIDAAVSGDSLGIMGVCVGHFTIGASLTLVGESRLEHPTPTLDGNNSGTVLRVTAATVWLKHLTVTGGSAATKGGGIYNAGGSLTVAESTSIMGNTAVEVGGGIYNAGGVVRLIRSASVTGNTARAGGGIFNSFGKVILRGWSSVTGNTAVQTSGGGIFNLGTVRLKGAASVTGNTAVTYDGGIYDSGTPPSLLQACAGWTGAISPNTPNEPDEPQTITC